MTLGDAVLIRPSDELSEMKLNDLVGKRGKLIEMRIRDNIIRGGWVRFATPYLNEIEWYIPYNSISNE